MHRFSTLMDRLGYQFKQQQLLRQALTHRSYSGTHNERLEFLGDAVLNFIVAALIYNKFTDMKEGDMSRLRANLVNQTALAEIAADINLSSYLYLGEGELKSGGSKRPSILSDAVEAVLGAVFLDGGYAAAKQVISQQYETRIKRINPITLGKDPKTLLQEYCQARKLPLPIYTVTGTHGAAHDQRFDVQCQVASLSAPTTASAGNRRAAEQQAAQRALAQLDASLVNPPSSHS